METRENSEIAKLGFGLMRLPRKGVRIDVAQVSQMVDMFLEAGFTYFDTARIYPGSEAATRKALVTRHPRDSYVIATKLNTMIAPTPKLARRQIDTSLRNLGCDYIDYYLLHSLTPASYKSYDALKLWDYVADLKRTGKVCNYGFSFHAGPQLLDKILTDHPDVDFVQLQINYADWDNPRITSRANYEVARAHGKPIVVMEPVKGGTLANPAPKIRELMEEANPGASPASWAIRFAASLEGILTVLSGMSNVEQMADNISYMRDFKPLDDDEMEVIRQVREIAGDSKDIPCTACGYCREGCPKQIPIPDVFAAMNKQLVGGQMEEARVAYRQAVAGVSPASACIACGTCEATCPQHIDIIAQLRECATALE
ncbi:MAG: aldo/keto reductase [Eggerthellaceae bacterium]|nr:aldo/keto reductase [Eggerthellaceae bacterium]